MRAYTSMMNDELDAEKERIDKKYAELKSFGLSLDMSRGKPSKAQLDLSTPMLTILESASDCVSEDGTDCRNYGVIDGIPEAKALMATLLDDSAENTIVFGNSSLTVMYDAIARCMTFGCLGGTPWSELDEVAFICPVPGYDRHFSITEQFGIKMIPVKMDEDGPCMDDVERISSSSDSVKGIWCVPKYSNPSGIVYSKEVVERLANMKCKASDFRIFWDNAYCVHGLYPNDDIELYDIARACIDAGNPNRYLKFASTSKITFPGAGIAGFASSPDNVAQTKKIISSQMIGSDKLNQLRHVRFLPNKSAVKDHMAKQADILRPKFEIVERKLRESLGGLDIARWTNPKGGYFISFDGMKNTAKRTIELASQAGVKLTSAGATWPYGEDPNDSNIRIAPSMPPIEELDAALDVFICCVKKAALEVLSA